MCPPPSPCPHFWRISVSLSHVLSVYVPMSMLHRTLASPKANNIEPGLYRDKEDSPRCTRGIKRMFRKEATQMKIQPVQVNFLKLTYSKLSTCEKIG